MKLFGFDTDESVDQIIAGSSDLPDTAKGSKQKPLPTGIGYDWKPNAVETQHDIVQAETRDRIIREATKREALFKTRTKELEQNLEPVKIEDSTILEKVKSSVESVVNPIKEVAIQGLQSKPMQDLLHGGELPFTKVGKAWLTGAEIGIFREKDWMLHSATDTDLTKPHFDKLYGGHTRQARDAGSFYGGYDAAMRFPDRLDELATLGEVYQLVSALRRSGSKEASWKDEMDDARANVAGIEAARKDIAKGKRYKLGYELNEDIITKANQYVKTKTKK